MKCLKCFLFGHERWPVVNDSKLPLRKQRTKGYICRRCFEVKKIDKM